jgi:hypothetical protein
MPVVDLHLLFCRPQAHHRPSVHRRVSSICSDAPVARVLDAGMPRACRQRMRKLDGVVLDSRRAKGELTSRVSRFAPNAVAEKLAGLAAELSARRLHMKPLAFRARPSRLGAR